MQLCIAQPNYSLSRNNQQLSLLVWLKASFMLGGNSSPHSSYHTFLNTWYYVPSCLFNFSGKEHYSSQSLFMEGGFISSPNHSHYHSCRNSHPCFSLSCYYISLSPSYCGYTDYFWHQMLSCQCTATSAPFTQNVYQILWPSGLLTRPCVRSKMAIRSSKKSQRQRNTTNIQRL